MAFLNARCVFCRKYVKFYIDTSDTDKILPCPECSLSLKLTYIGDGVFEIGKVPNVATPTTADDTMYC